MVGTGQIQSVSAGQVALRHMPLIQDKPPAQLALLVQLRLQDCGGLVGAVGGGVAVGVIGATAQRVVEPAAVAINLKRIMAKVPEPLLAVELVPVIIMVPVDSSV